MWITTTGIFVAILGLLVAAEAISAGYFWLRARAAERQLYETRFLCRLLRLR